MEEGLFHVDVTLSGGNNPMPTSLSRVNFLKILSQAIHWSEGFVLGAPEQDLSGPWLRVTAKRHTFPDLSADFASLLVDRVKTREFCRWRRAGGVRRSFDFIHANYIKG